MDKQGKIKGKFNIIDILVILLIIAMIIGIAVRFKSSVTTAVKSDVDLEYVVKIESIKECSVNALEKMGKVTDKKSNLDLGEVVNVDYEPTKYQSTTADGKIVLSEQPERYTVYLTIRTKGKESDNSYVLADSNELSVGSTAQIFTKYIDTTGKVVSIKKIEE